MCHTQELSLYGNKIGDAGITALAKAVESGALPKCNTIKVGLNPRATAEAKKALQDAIASRK